MSGFADVQTPVFSCAGASIGPMPEVKFGGIFDAVNEAIEWVTGTSLRREVTDYLVGDTVKLSTQVETWKALAGAMDAIEANVTSGLTEILTTWEGEAATAMAQHFEKWKTFLDEQATTMRSIAESLDDMGRNCWDMAQTVVDLIRTVIDVVSAGLAGAAIPAYGQWKLIKSVKEAISMVWKAIQCIKVFMDLVILVKNAVVLTYDIFTTDAVPTSAGASAPKAAA